MLAATYSGPVRVPDGCRVVCAMAVASAYQLQSEGVRITIPQQGQEERTLDLTRPAQWLLKTKLDDPGQVWDFITRLESTSTVTAHDIGLTAESRDGLQSIDYSGALDSGYDGPTLHAVTEKLVDIVQGDSLRMTVGGMRFATGQGLLDWLQASNQSFDLSKVRQ